MTTMEPRLAERRRGVSEDRARGRLKWILVTILLLAGIVGGRVVFVLPGSRGAVLLGMEKLILPELGHLAGEAVKTR